MKVACTNIVAAPRFRAERGAESSLARVGAPLARLELQIALPILFARLPHL